MPILWRIPQFARIVQYPFKVQTDGRSCLLRYLVFNWEIEVIRTIVQSPQGLLILSQDGSTNPRDIVEIDPAQRKMPQILCHCNFDATDLGEVRLERPAEKAGKPSRLILKLPRPFKMLQSFFEFE